MELNELIMLLDYPEKLSSTISEMRLRADLSEEEQGFLILYDQYDGNTDQIKNYLKKTKEQILPKQKISDRKLSFYRVAAVFIVLLGTGILFLLNRTETSTSFVKETAQSSIFKEPGIPIFMGVETSIDWAPLMFALDKETPERAIAEWKKIEHLAPENDTLIYFGGIVYEQLHKLESAKQLFEKNLKSNSVFADRSAYFLLQIAKSEGEKETAKKLLERLKKTEDLDLKPFVLEEQRSLR